MESRWPCVRCCCRGAGEAVLLFKRGFLTREKLLELRLLGIGAKRLRLFQELLQRLFLGVGRQKGVGAGNFLLQVYK